jgi:hypothetical protein
VPLFVSLHYTHAAEIFAVEPSSMYVVA